MITATVDTRDLERALQKLGRGTSRRFLNQALNRALTTMGKVSREEIRRDLNLRPAPIRKAMRQVKARGGAGVAEIRVDARPLPLIAFGATQTRRGVTFRVKKRGGRQRFRHAFIRKIRADENRERAVPSTKQVFERIPGRARPRIARERYAALPIRKVVGVSVAGQFDQKLSARVLAAGQERFVRELRGQISRYTKDRRRRSADVMRVVQATPFR